MLLHIGSEIDKVRAISCDSDGDVLIFLRFLLSRSQYFLIDDIAFDVSAADAEISSQERFKFAHAIAVVAGEAGGMQVKDERSSSRSESLVDFAGRFQQSCKDLPGFVSLFFVYS